MNHLNLDNVNISIDNQAIINNASFSLNAGEIACLLGPSGCGKTTILRSIAGLQDIDAGEIKLINKIVSSKNKTLPIEKRQVGMMFQDFALFPHLNIAENICFGIKKFSKQKQTQRLQELLQLVELTGKEKRYPHELSGGQQQRVALARALAARPNILLLDEPFSSIDSELRPQLAKLIREAIKKEEMTALMVTHDQQEAFAMADNIGVIHQGSIQQWNTPYDLYHQPKNRFVANFIGHSCFIDGKVITQNNQQKLETVFGNIDLPTSIDKKTNYEVLIRPDDIIHDDNSDFMGTILEKQFLGAEFLYTLQLPNKEQVYCYAPSHHNHEIGEQIGIQADIEHVVYFEN